MAKKDKVKKSYICWVVVLFLAIIFFWWENNALVVSEYAFEAEEISDAFDGYRIVQISDLHNKRFGKNQKGILEKIEECNPDIIVITGDLVDSNHTNIEKAMEFVEGVVKLAPVYYVTGNHEKWLGEEEQLLEQIEQADINCLMNKTEIITVKDASIYLIGLDDANLLDDTLNGLASKTEDGFTLLLAHEPQNLFRYSACGMDLVLSGHAHGGQFRLPFIGGVVAPDQGFFPEYTAGFYVEGSTSMIVSRGLGNSIIPIRIFNRPEVVCVELKKK